MKKLVLFLLCFCTLSLTYGQINGNGKIKTETRRIDNIRQVLVNINGQVEIVCSSGESKVEVTYDENILPYLRTKKKNGVLELDQKEWIEGTQEVVIKIYTDELDYLENDSWSKIKVINLNQDDLKVKSGLSDIYLSGKVKNLRMRSKSSSINAFDLVAENAEVRVQEDGRIFVNATKSLVAKNSEEGEIRYKGKPGKVEGMVKPGNRYVDRPKIDTRFIDIKFKNNGPSTIQAYVKGPKPDGSSFSYGLPFRPFVTRSEHWSIGTKLYRVNAFGRKRLIHTVTEADEGKVVLLRKE